MWRHQGPETKAMLLDSTTNGHRASISFEESCSFGTVFKALLPTMDKVVAVKVLNMERPCSSIDYQGNEFRALIYEFMPHRSVDMWLHRKEVEDIAHCDLKPNNVLLDDDFIALSGVRETISYAAPEYGMGGKPSIHGDRYSFGVLLLEMFTGKRPTSELFEGNYTLHSYTKSALPDPSAVKDLQRAAWQ
ncbi:hypothetical protein F2Q70_00016994 [Brassica cretica]|uniref:Protein kinase domain-containing protein n=1 Tax=Brassica cretica TaxID=69181 RepID=A0A8S9HZS8_BRACR|nr:hypothetical protein F2Q70_00016994 [Brassica cretica]KAF2600070.1 hypothetical protein F2Q68_00009955 [Brassica cretica]